MATLKSNTDKVFPCVQCGSTSANIVRESADPRMKCNSCGFMYDASASIEAQNQGVIPDGPPVIEDPTPTVDPVRSPSGGDSVRADEVGPVSKAPRTPSYVFLSKDRLQHEFATKKSVRSVTLKWEYEGRSFDVFELAPKQISTKVDIT